MLRRLSVRSAHLSIGLGAAVCLCAVALLLSLSSGRAGSDRPRKEALDEQALRALVGGQTPTNFCNKVGGDCAGADVMCPSPAPANVCVNIGDPCGGRLYTKRENPDQCSGSPGAPSCTPDDSTMSVECKRTFACLCNRPPMGQWYCYSGDRTSNTCVDVFEARNCSYFPCLP
jgi:hypothetical protein